MTNIVGILNITPDSFSDSGKHYAPELAIKHTVQLIEDGADVIDIGAESTRPGATIISPEEELSRLKPVLQQIISIAHDNNVKVSLDTYKPETAEFGLDCGIDYINDVTGLNSNKMIQLVSESTKPFIVTHNLWKPECDKWVLNDTTEQNSNGHTEMINEVTQWAKMKIDQLDQYGINTSNIIIDPGIGFGKTNVQSWNLINNISKIASLGTAVYVGHSRKRLCNLEDSKTASPNRDAYTLAISTLLAMHGVDYIRVHDVAPHKLLFNKIFNTTDKDTTNV